MMILRQELWPLRPAIGLTFESAIALGINRCLSDPLYHQDWVPKKILRAKIEISCSSGGSADGQARGKDLAFYLVPFTNQLKAVATDTQ